MRMRMRNRERESEATEWQTIIVALCKRVKCFANRRKPPQMSNPLSLEHWIKSFIIILGNVLRNKFYIIISVVPISHGIQHINFDAMYFIWFFYFILRDDFHSGACVPLVRYYSRLVWRMRAMRIFTTNQKEDINMLRMMVAEFTKAQSIHLQKCVYTYVHCH